MGDWSLTVLGSGAHHNTTIEKLVENDADILFAKFIDDLKLRGHTIRHAEMVTGAKTTVEGRP
jgi:hypothetical protein